MGHHDRKEFVFRIQDAEGRGPFRPAFTNLWLSDRASYRFTDDDYRAWQEVWPDARFRPGLTVACGCTSIKQLQLWFTEDEYDTLQGYHFNCVRLKVDEVVRRSATQCVFERTKPLVVAATVVDFRTGAPVA